MKSTQKGGMMIWLIVLIVILGGAVYIKSLKQQLAAQPGGSVSTGGTGTADTCGLLIAAPKPGAKVTFPLTISGTIDNTDPQRCMWGMFEGQAGTVQLYAQVHGQWYKVGAETFVPVENWMTSKTSFKVTLNPGTAAASLAPGTPLRLTFFSENPSGDPVRDRLIDYPLTY